MLPFPPYSNWKKKRGTLIIFSWGEQQKGRARSHEKLGGVKVGAKDAKE